MNSGGILTDSRFVPEVRPRQQLSRLVDQHEASGLNQVTPDTAKRA